MKPISVQLYSLREESKVDFPKVLRDLAEIGYKGVEPAGFYGMTPVVFKKMTGDLGLRISTTHSPWARSTDNIQEVIDTAGALGIDLVACGYGADNFKDLDAIKSTADTVNSVMDKLKGTGLTLFMHNHAWEFERIDGRLKYDYFFDYCPDVKLEIDTYWAANFGAENPAEMVARYKDRAVLLHIKDGSLVKGDAMLAVGSGKNNIREIIAAADPKVLRWLVVELDRCDTDMTTAVAESYKYLVSNKLAEGNK